MKFKILLVLTLFVSSLSIAIPNSANAVSKVEKLNSDCPTCSENVESKGSLKDKKEALKLVKKTTGTKLKKDVQEYLIRVEKSTTQKVALVQVQHEVGQYNQYYLDLEGEELLFTRKASVTNINDNKASFVLEQDGEKVIDVVINKKNKTLVDQSTNETFKISELQNLQKRSTTNSSKQLSFKGLVTTQDSNLEKCKDLVTDLLVSGGTAACAGACAAVFNVAGVIVCTALCSFIETRLGKAGSDQICTQFFG
ncbi:hypothetical protein [Halobacillus litoralis]|uniref:hypothetical protein n=1 Tax=Halobacillus litoralis TaxID=45668 RepID=UPI001CD56AF7|nr:hypothetical protein [Halobacillus litoralis]MCA1020575.1 hypothetical protein [Halobacillus litoralis]